MRREEVDVASTRMVEEEAHGFVSLRASWDSLTETPSS